MLGMLQLIFDTNFKGKACPKTLLELGSTKTDKLCVVSLINWTRVRSRLN